MQHIITKSEIVQGIKSLDVIERFNIITDIWDDIKESQELKTISEDDRELLLNRLANYRSDQGSATDWAKLKQEVHNRYAGKS
uniref:Putative addiction module component, TIGR02574 family n=1 Tax=Candidatus Kentrum sp. UNK TaxID=2126344 RepID=A0A451ATI2_9GAMM|nr:MAG: putative addiction module component, TIGR02574 family [Candidatus Kentron sp. UNK]VFK69371.1 MAG: putative addiction module component, TIGR02574 family [Candidatus Kentron sp. UNK]